MKLLVNTTNFEKTIELAESINETYDKSTTFHCYWNGDLNEKHYYSILSCYYFNVFKNKHKIILWLENNNNNGYNEKIKKYAEIRVFSLKDEKKISVFLENCDFYYNKSLSFYSDVVRYILLYNYGGVWFDLDCFFLRNFDPIFHNYENEICVYQWENQNYPNGAIYISLEPKSEKMKNNILFIIDRNRGWGFQEANLTYDLPVDLLVLPCSWFNGCWIENPYKIYISGNNLFFENSEKTYNFENFFKGSFCYHWHNNWDKRVEEKSIMRQLLNIIEKNCDF
jgi:Glycosyltransferase sugar-binding region containing DXD motif